ncbi:MAG: SulP family inorganic anion transporter [Gemmatimonadetes bacterium]|nr:SulP family inorganic anion transporter [Gemmatimonadota bacterium]
MLVPKLWSTLRGYNRQLFAADATAGVIVGIVALPLSIAFAIASGLGPQAGLYTAIIAGFLISALGGSRVQIGGPTGAFVVIVYGIVQKYGVDGLTVATIMAGVILIILGLAKLGGAIKFIPHPVVTGFTSGIAVIIFSGQMRDFFGLAMKSVPAEFIGKVEALAEHANTGSPWAIAIALATVLIVTFGPRVTTKVPSPFVALIATTALVQLAGLPLETIGSRFGGIDASFPHPHWPSISLHDLTQLVAPAFTIAMLGGIESLLSAVVADGMIGTRHRSNMELVAQGVANVVTPLFGGIPATGAIARTATNIKAGGRTPIAGIVHALTLLVITLFFGRWAALIPMATLAGILVVVAYHMSEWRTFRATLRAPRSDVAVLLTTFGLTVLVDLTVALGVGMVLASFLFMRKMAEVTQVAAVTDMFTDREGEDAQGVALRSVPKGVEIYEIDGPFFFGAAEKFKETIASMARPPRVLILRMRKVGLLDATGIALIRDLSQKGRHDGTTLVLSGLHSQPMVALTNSDLLDVIGEDNCVGDIDDAIARAAVLMAAPVPPRR